VQLVDEQQDATVGGDDLLQDGLQALFELAAELAAGDQAADVQRHQARTLQRRGHLAVGDAQGQPLGDRGLAHAGLADEDGVVLAPAGEDLDRLLDLFVAPDHRVDATRGRLGREVAAELVESRRRRAGRATLRARSIGLALSGRQAAGAGLAHDGAVLGAVGRRVDHLDGAGPPGARGARRSTDGVLVRGFQGVPLPG
jgi:hypothetical protein